MIERRTYRAVSKEATASARDRRRTRRAAAEAMVADPVASTVFIAAITHDLVRHRSIVTLQWKDDPEKKVAVPVPYGCPLDALAGEAGSALQALSAEIARLHIVPPDHAPGAPVLT